MLDIEIGCRRSGEGGAFLAILLDGDGVWEVRSGIAFLGRRWRVRRGREGAKQGTRFWLSLCKHGDCFIDSSFLAGKEAKEAGGTYDGSPTTPFQRSTGQSKDGKARKKIPGAGGVIQCKSPGRTGQRAQPAPSR